MFIIGIELGRPSDFTAISVVEPLIWHYDHGWVSEADLTPGERRESFRRPDGTWVDEEESPIWVRSLDRFVPGTPYPKILDEVARYFAHRGLRKATGAIVVDRSMVGANIVDELRRRDGVPYVTSVRLTAGGDVGSISGGYSVPKVDVAGVLRILLDKSLLKIGPVQDRGALLAELQNFRPEVRTGVDPASIDWRDGAHDDLVLAVGIAAWYARRNGGRIQSDYETLQAFGSPWQ